jgi:hypothetical protein
MSAASTKYSLIREETFLWTICEKVKRLGAPTQNLFSREVKTCLPRRTEDSRELVLRSDLPPPAVAGFAKAGALLRRVASRVESERLRADS